jgi:TBC1 domain family member 5
MPENLYFREPDTQRMLLDILFIYCKLNADVGYRQGMHEILAPILWVVSRDALSLDTKEEGSDSIGENDHLILTILSPKYIEHDAFTLFGILMQTAKTFYETSSNISSSGSSAMGSSAIVERSRRIHEDYLRKVDPQLTSHLIDIDILPQIFIM